MLSEISIRNVVLIEALDLELAGGFTALTGETGAGKSIILDALGMAIGARSDKSLVRVGAQKAQCIARFSILAEHRVWAILEEAGLEADRDDALVLRRTLTAEGRSQAYINDQPVSARLLANVGRELLEVHGQHDGRGLLDATTHRAQLDDFGDYPKLLSQCETLYADMSEARNVLAALTQRHADSEETRDFLTHSIAELDRLAAEPGEDEKLAGERRLLQHSEGVLSELGDARTALGEGGEYEARIAQALAGLERLHSKIGDTGAGISALKKAISALEKALIELDEARAAVGGAAQEFQFEPGRLDHVEERLFALRAASRKYDVEVGELANLRQKFGDDLLALEYFDSEFKAAKDKVSQAEKGYATTASKLSKARRAAAKILDKQVVGELPPLKMARAEFVTKIEPCPDSAKGCDQIGFQIRTNPDTPLGPLGKIASGGELARFALAIKVAQIREDEKPGSGKTMIFDEVDQGVGGAVADAVGKRLARLSGQGQVMVVTHSPQVAACADHQYLIAKSVQGKTTHTDIALLSAEAREEEIARMLAGEQITDAARAAARQLMQAS